jgi:hypothetical protein
MLAGVDGERAGAQHPQYARELHDLWTRPVHDGDPLHVSTFGCLSVHLENIPF